MSPWTEGLRESLLQTKWVIAAKIIREHERCTHVYRLRYNWRLRLKAQWWRRRAARRRSYNLLARVHPFNRDEWVLGQWEMVT